MTTTVNINSALKINVTPIQGGAIGGVLFQKSDGKLGQSSNLHWDDVNGRMSIGQGTAPGARLDVRLPGVLSTDLGFRVRNSANTANRFEVKGNGRYSLNDGLGSLSNAITYLDDGRLFLAKSSINFIEFNDTQPHRLFSANGWQFVASGTGKRIDFEVNGATLMRMIDRTIQVGSFNTSDGATNTMYFLDGIAPTTNHPDIFKMYSQFGRPNFRTSAGEIIQFYKQDLPTTPTTSEIATLLSNLGLANLI